LDSRAPQCDLDSRAPQVGSFGVIQNSRLDGVSSMDLVYGALFTSELVLPHLSDTRVAYFLSVCIHSPDAIEMWYLVHSCN
jgi:hypothetical protein